MDSTAFLPEIPKQQQRWRLLHASGLPSSFPPFWRFQIASNFSQPSVNFPPDLYIAPTPPQGTSFDSVISNKLDQSRLHTCAVHSHTWRRRRRLSPDPAPATLAAASQWPAAAGGAPSSGAPSRPARRRRRHRRCGSAASGRSSRARGTGTAC